MGPPMIRYRRESDDCLKYTRNFKSLVRCRLHVRMPSTQRSRRHCILAIECMSAVLNSICHRILKQDIGAETSKNNI